jgi:selenocysteine lyase/cysteine desulfurase
LGQIAGATVRDTGDVKSGIVTFTLNGCESKEVERLLAMQPRRINVATSTFRSTMLNMQSRGLREVVRASVHAYNTEQDIEVVAQTIETAMVPKLAKAAR